MLYGVDKQLARAERRRVPEKWLHLLDVLGGWPGGWVGRKYFRHKTRKTSFVITFWLTVVIHVTLITLLCLSALGVFAEN